MIMPGELIRRIGFNVLDTLQGGGQNTLKEVNKSEIVHGISPEYEDRALQRIMRYAAENSPYYKEMFAGKDTGERLDLAEFPVMNKSDYNEHMADVLSEPFQGAEDELSVLSTSGSTGSPFKVYCDRNKMNHVNMNFISVMELNGFRLGMKRGEFRVWIKGKNAISTMKSVRNNLIMIDISNMGDARLGEICETIRKQKIQVLTAYSSALTALAGYIRRHHVDISSWKVEMIFSMGEALPQGTYDLLKEIFGFAPVRSYGNNENGFIAVQLNEEDRYTADLYNYYIEILKLDADQPAAPGETGRIVVTDLYNQAFPMIRYDTGDTGKFVRVVDENGRIHGYFTEIYGRRGSLLYNTSGEPLSIHVFMNVLINLEGRVRQAQCIQWEKNRYELKLNLVPGKITADEVVGLYRAYLGEDARIEVTLVDEVPVQASGKHMVCLQKCSDYL